VSKKAMWATARAIWAALSVLIVFAGIVLFVARYEKELERINWPLVSILCGFAVAGCAVYRWQHNPGSYDLVDLVKNPKTGLADPYRHFLFIFGGLGAWSVVQVVLAKEWSTLTPLLGLLLGYFVAKPAVDGLAEAWCNRPAAVMQPTDNGSPKP